MQWVKVDNAFFIKCNAYGANNNKQLLHNENGRPSVLVAKLHYHKGLHDFIIPMKSNINASEGSANYFALPPNSRTKDGFHHGIYYVKLFPIDRSYIHPYFYDKNPYLKSIKSIIDEPQNTKKIVDACQTYLNEYEKGNRHPYTPDIDKILEMLQQK